MSISNFSNGNLVKDVRCKKLLPRNEMESNFPLLEAQQVFIVYLSHSSCIIKDLFEILNNSIGPSSLRALSRKYVSTINGVFSLLLVSSSPPVTFLPEGVIIGF